MKLLKTITRDIENAKKAFLKITSISEAKLLFVYESKEDIDNVMFELSKKYPVYRYQIQLLDNITITINFN